MPKNAFYSLNLIKNDEIQSFVYRLQIKTVYRYIPHMERSVI